VVLACFQLAWRVEGSQADTDRVLEIVDTDYATKESLDAVNGTLEDLRRGQVSIQPPHNTGGPSRGFPGPG
jgi:hypothetical protein